MVVAFRILSGLALLLLIGPCGAEEDEWAGLRIANAIGLDPHLLKVSINGDAWSKQGLASGEVSSLRRLESGRYRLSFSQDGLLGREVRLTLKPGQSVTLIPHAQRSKEGLDWRIQVLKLDAAPVISGRMARVVDVGFAPRRLLELKPAGRSWVPMSLSRLEVERFGIDQHRGYLPMRVGRQKLNSMPVFEQGHHVVVLYDLKGGGLGSLFFRDRAWPDAPLLQSQP